MQPVFEVTTLASVDFVWFEVSCVGVMVPVNGQESWAAVTAEAPGAPAVDGTALALVGVLSGPQAATSSPLATTNAAESSAEARRRRGRAVATPGCSAVRP